VLGSGQSPAEEEEEVVVGSGQGPGSEEEAAVVVGSGEEVWRLE